MLPNPPEKPNNLDLKTEECKPSALAQRIESMSDLLEVTGLRGKYEIAVQREKLTLDNFIKLVQMDQGGLTSTLLKRCKMSCGHFTELVVAYEKHSLQGGKTLQKTSQVQSLLQEARRG